MYQTILVPLDGSKESEATLPQVESLARQHNATVIFLKIIEAQLILVPAKPFQTKFSSPKERPHHKKVRSYLEIKQEFFQAKGLKAEIRVEEGSIVETIISVAKREQADLIVMTSRFGSSWSRLLYGNVAADVLDQAGRPVLLIRPGGNETAPVSVRSSVKTRPAEGLIQQILAFVRGTLKEP